MYFCTEFSQNHYITEYNVPLEVLIRLVFHTIYHKFYAHCLFLILRMKYIKVYTSLLVFQNALIDGVLTSSGTKPWLRLFSWKILENNVRVYLLKSEHLPVLRTACAQQICRVTPVLAGIKKFRGELKICAIWVALRWPREKCCPFLNTKLPNWSTWETS